MLTVLSFVWIQRDFSTWRLSIAETYKCHNFHQSWFLTSTFYDFWIGHPLSEITFFRYQKPRGPSECLEDKKILNFRTNALFISNVEKKTRSIIKKSRKNARKDSRLISHSARKPRTTPKTQFDSKTQKRSKRFLFLHTQFWVKKNKDWCYSLTLRRPK